MTDQLIVVVTLLVLAVDVLIGSVVLVQSIRRMHRSEWFRPKKNNKGNLITPRP